MSNVWFISDTHFCHNQEFIYAARGFHSIEEMNENIINNWNRLVHSNDIVYHLGDFALTDVDTAIDFSHLLKGHIRLAIGNHDTPKKIEKFKSLGIFEDIQFGYRIKYHKATFLLTHYPQLTGNFNSSKTYSIHGHTHSPHCFSEYDMMYHVGCDAHNCYPVALEDMLQQIHNRKMTILGQE